ncbi:DsrE family protein [Halomonas sp. DP5N14-9]|uniref:DsrE family protein n=1 Tax=Halomonas sp. DP5N14-9 TaxID=2859075 RepID=UPI001C993212|nr:DsrE family protein [Halomonas sp. DP5N14-9]MBY5942362.1 DsrE family protein [Halomonas sp. DP5N14-9]
MIEEPNDDSGDLLVILRHGPHGTSYLKEGLDTALVAAAFGRRVSLLFMASGVAALVPGQGAGPLGQKGTQPTLAMLEMYDIDRLFVDGAGLAELGVAPETLTPDAIVIEGDAIAALMAEHALVLTF